MSRSRAPLAAAVLLASSVAGAARAQGIDLSGGGPVDVTARSGFEWRENEQKVIATGDARAVRGDVTVTADRLVAFYRKKAPVAGAAASGQPAVPLPARPGPAPAPASGGVTEADEGNNEVYRLEAEGNVEIYTPTDHGHGDRAVYDIDQAVLVMTGHDMKLTTPQQVMTARDTMEYWSQKHMAVGRGNAVVITSDGRRLAADTLVGFTETDDPQPGTAAPVKPVAAAASGAPPKDPIAASGKLKRVEAYGNVEIRTTADLVRGERGLYLPDTGMARVVGHVRITHGQNQVNGPAADLNMKTGIAHIVSDPGQRVTGLIVPNDPALKSRPQDKPAAPSASPAGASSK